MAYDPTPKLKVNFIEDIESTGAKEGFIKLVNERGKEVAKYNNYGRFVFENVAPVLMLNEGGALSYDEYLKNVPENQDRVRRNKYGMFAFLKLKDFDHGHEMIHFFSQDPQDTTKLVWFAEKLTQEIEKAGCTPDDIQEHVFRLGKEPAKKGVMGRWFIKYEGTVDDLSLMQDPAKFSEEKRERMMEEQEPPKENKEIQNFKLNDSEKKIIEKIDEFAKAGRFDATTRERIAVTLEAGFGANKTSKARADYIAQHAEDYFQHLTIED